MNVIKTPGINFDLWSSLHWVNEGDYHSQANNGCDCNKFLLSKLFLI